MTNFEKITKNPQELSKHLAETKFQIEVETYRNIKDILMRFDMLPGRELVNVLEFIGWQILESYAKKSNEKEKNILEWLENTEVINGK